MRRHVTVVLFFMTIYCSVAVVGQDLNGQMGYEGPNPSTRINADADKGILHVTSRIPNLRFDSNRGILRVVRQSSGDWDVLVSPGTHILKIEADNYEQLSLPPFNFQKLKLYELRISPKVLPQKFGSSLGKGSLFVDTDPTGSKLEIPEMEGEWTTPKKFKSIKAGIWTLIFTRDKYDTLITEILVNKDSVVQPPPFKLVPKFGFLAINSNVDARLLIDGSQVSFLQGSRIEVNRGNHDILLLKNRYEDYRDSVEVTPGDTLAVNVELKPKFGFVQFEDFQGTDVWIDSKLIEPRGLVEVDAGKRTLRIKHRRLGELTKSLTIDAGQRIVLRLDDFEKTGILNVSTDVLADISIDGRIIGKTLASQDLLPGPYRVDITHPKLGQRSEDVIVQSGQRTSLFISMLPSQSTAQWLSLLPGGSQIYKRQTTKGFLYAGVFVVSAGASMYLLSDYNKKNDEYNAAISGYKNAATNTEAAYYRQRVMSFYDGVHSAYKLRNTAFITTGAIYIWNIVDALLFAPDFGYRGEGKNGMSIGLNLNGDGIKFALSMGL